MSKFKRKNKPGTTRQEIRSKIIGSSTPSSDRTNSGIPKATKEEAAGCNVYVAQHMYRCFGWRSWMGAFIERDEPKLSLP